MPFKRPASPSGSRPGPSEVSTKRNKISTLKGITVYLVQAKLDAASIEELLRLAERHTSGVCSNPKDAHVIITAVGMRRRLERHMSWKVARTKAVVTPQWLRDSIHAGKPLPYEDYVAVQGLDDMIVELCTDCRADPCMCSDVLQRSTSSTSRAAASPRRASSSALPAPSSSSVKQPLAIPPHLLPPDSPLRTNVEKLDSMSRYACRRASPLVCPNQALVEELSIIRQSRMLEGEDRSALSYARAASVVKAYPHKIRSSKQAEKLPYIGPKVSNMIEQFLDTGKIPEIERIKSSERFKTLSLFCSIYGIGPTFARRLYNLGLRSLDDLEIYYGVERETIMNHGEILEEQKPRKFARGKHGELDDSLGESWIKIALGLREDLLKKIPRAEVEEIGRVIMKELDEVQPGCVSTIAGGYRRGKQESNDVDIVFTHQDASKIKGLCKRLVRRLYDRGLVTHVMHLSRFHSKDPFRTTHWDSLEKALTVFVLPSSSPSCPRPRRRLDLIFAPPEVYWTAVLGWTGSIMFERDIRAWAKDKCGMKFDSSGITRRYDTKEFYPRTEKEVFDLLGLEWIDPTLRNADL